MHPVIIFLDKFLFLLLAQFFFELFGQYVSCWRSRDLFEFCGLQPAFVVRELLLDLNNAYAIVIKSLEEHGSYVLVHLLCIVTHLRAMIVPQETILQRKGVHDSKLLPDDDSGRT